MTKFCKNCIFSLLSYRSGFTQYQCDNELNLGGVSLIDGERNHQWTIEYLRSDVGYCGPEGNWFEAKALPQGYVGLGYIPSNDGVIKGETLQERFDRLRAKAQSNKSKSLKNTTLEDIL